MSYFIPMLLIYFESIINFTNRYFFCRNDIHPLEDFPPKTHLIMVLDLSNEMMDRSMVQNMYVYH